MNTERDLGPRFELQTSQDDPKIGQKVESGVSIVVCCHNSATRLPTTLRHLAAQESTKGIPWEVIIVDNASADSTGEVAISNWPANPLAPLRVVCEPTAGLIHARLKGIAESSYELVSFVDDDNWVCSNWVLLVSDVMSLHPEVGACGGQVEAVCEVTPPVWFDRHKESYAVGCQAAHGGDVTDDQGYLWGAGLTIRKRAFLRLVSSGFRFLMIGRKGSSLTAGEDAELCCALRLAGWRLWYEPRLRMHHYLPAARLSWSYLRRVIRGFGASSVGLDSYLHLLGNRPSAVFGPFRTSWLWQAFLASAKLGAHAAYYLVTRVACDDGCPAALRVEWQLGRILELISQRKKYREGIRRVREAAWHDSGKTAGLPFVPAS